MYWTKPIIWSFICCILLFEPLLFKIECCETEFTISCKLIHTNLGVAKPFQNPLITLVMKNQVLPHVLNTRFHTFILNFEIQCCYPALESLESKSIVISEQFYRLFLGSHELCMWSNPLQLTSYQRLLFCI